MCTKLPQLMKKMKKYGKYMKKYSFLNEEKKHEKIWRKKHEKIWKILKYMKNIFFREKHKNIKFECTKLCHPNGPKRYTTCAGLPQLNLVGPSWIYFGKT